MATYYEKSPPKFGVGESVFMNEAGEWIEGEVLEVGDETILVQWMNAEYATEYQAEEWQSIYHNLPASVVNY